MYSPLIQKIINLFSKFPSIGPKTAARFVFYLTKMPKEDFDDLINSLIELKEKIKLCPFCFNFFEGENELCEICSSPLRDKKTLCIVEKETDLQSIENTTKYNGLYFVLGGTLSNLRKKDIEKLRIQELTDRIKEPQKFNISTNGFEEIILAINPTPEGEATILYLERLLKPLNIKISKLAKGLPIGGELEYADIETLSSALDNRKE